MKRPEKIFSLFAVGLVCLAIFNSGKRWNIPLYDTMALLEVWQVLIVLAGVLVLFAGIYWGASRFNLLLIPVITHIHVFVTIWESMFIGLAWIVAFPGGIPKPSIDLLQIISHSISYVWFPAQVLFVFNLILGIVRKLRNRIPQ